MEVIIMLIPMALLLAAFFIGGFIWMTKKGQYDDLETPGMRMLLDDNNIDKDNILDKYRGVHKVIDNEQKPSKEGEV
jgi:cbb3-type cytochrome oxidase maturation protein